MKMLKKNQLIILVVAIMLITIGYLNYNGEDNENSMIGATNSSNFGDAALVSSSALVDNEGYTEETSENTVEESTVSTSNKQTWSTDDYFTNSKNERDKMYSESLETYQKMLDNTNLGTEQKKVATEEIKKLNDSKNSIMIAENLIKTKGFSDVVILINGESINVVVKADTLEPDAMAQIQNIISRELKAEIENIHIMNK